MRHPVIALALVTAATTAAAADPAQVQPAIDAAVAMHRYDDRLDVNSTWTNVAEGVVAVDNCRARIDAAVAAGVKLDQPFSLGGAADNDFLPHAGAGRSTLGLLRGYCEARAADVQLLRTYVVVREAAKTSVQLRGHEFPSVLARAAAVQRACVREVARAAATKRARPIVFERPDVALAEAADKVCAPLGAKIATMRAALLHETMAALAGDRGKRFEADQLWAERVFGSAKVALSTADDLRVASVWYVVLAELDERGDPRWLVRAYRWGAADRLVDMKETSGAGAEPPDDVFK